MDITAREVMDTGYSTLSPEMTIGEAFRVFQKAGEAHQQIVFGMVVTDAAGQLLGMLSMYDILLLIRPKHIHIWGEIKDVDVSGILDAALTRAGSMLVSDIMTTDLITITPDDAPAANHRHYDQKACPPAAGPGRGENGGHGVSVPGLPASPGQMFSVRPPP